MIKQTTPFVCSPYTCRGNGMGEWVAAEYRKAFPLQIWLFNPWTAQARDTEAINADPYGHEIVPPGEVADFTPHFDALQKAEALFAPPPIISALDVQQGGDHYKKLKIQPIEYIHANNLPFAEGCVVKYVTRWRDKDGIKDLKKAKHFLELLIELESRA